MPPPALLLQVDRRVRGALWRAQIEVQMEPLLMVVYPVVLQQGSHRSFWLQAAVPCSAEGQGRLCSRHPVSCLA